MRVKVRCSFGIEVEVPENVDPILYIEENGCPGTGRMGGELERLMELHSTQGTCWACASNGECKIIEDKNESDHQNVD